MRTRSAFYRVPALMCGVISLLALVGFMPDIHWSQLIFYAFLPACFLLMSSFLVRMHRELMRQRRRIARLEDHNQIDPATSHHHHETGDTDHVEREHSVPN